VACGERISLNRMLADLSEIAGRPLEPSYVESRPGDIKHSLADISAARERLGYEVRVGFREGLRRTYEHYARLRGEERSAGGELERSERDALERAR
jgi:nucleoside-diphosphate-sugar epimerase